MLDADPTKVSARAKKRGLPQLGTLGAGNHYAEIQARQASLLTGVECSVHNFTGVAEPAGSQSARPTFAA